VLPLQNLSIDPAQEYVADGTTEQLINVLAQLPGVRVISRTSAMRYKGTTRTLPEIGHELGADAIVEGSVAYAGGRVRVSVQLVDVRTDQHLWAHSYERDAADVLILQQEVAASIADEIRLQLSAADRATLARSRTVVPAAHDAYLRARYHLNKGAAEELTRSIDDFNEAIRLDPSDAPSYAGLAQAYIALTDFYERPTVMMPKARAAAEQALALDNRSAEAHMAFGAVRFLYDWNWSEAESELKQALALNPASADAHVWYAIFLAQMGRFEPAFAEISRASALDPLAVPVHINAGWIYYLGRQNDRAVAEWKKALDLEPTLGVVHTSIWLAYAQDGRPIDLAAIGADAGDESPLNMATVAGAYAMSGKRSEAEAVIARLHALAEHRYVCSYEIATTHAALHQDDEAFRWLRRGIEDRSSCMPDLKVDPRFERLRHDPRFVQLLREVGFAS
jgi:TolB-like protein/Tfp pilus assembly protein PilF